MSQPAPMSLIDKLEDPKYFIETFLFIVDKRRISVPFLLNPPQNRYYQNRSYYDLILKARKEGFSSLIEALWLHACIFNEHTRAVTLSHEMESTMRHFDRVRYYLDNMNSDAGNGEILKFVVGLDKESQRQLSFVDTNSSYWIGTAGSRSFGRGDDITHLHFSESAHYQNQDVLTSALEACVPNAYRVMETTANGVGEAFHRLWTEARDNPKESPWRNHFFAWFEDPTNRTELPAGIKTMKWNGLELKMKKQFNLDDEQVLWYRTKRAQMADKALMPQEYPGSDDEAFLSSGRHVFNMEHLKLLKEKAILNLPMNVGVLRDDGKVVQFIDDPEGTLKIWKMPRTGGNYAVFSDVAQGVPGGNWSVATVHDRATWEQVATLRIRINPGHWGKMLADLGTFYNFAIVAPENNSIGQGAIAILKELEYPHILKTNELWPNDKSPKEGFPTTEKNRALCIQALQMALEERTIGIHDTVAINELMTFIQNEDTGKFEAQKGCEDDCVMAMAIAAYCLKHVSLEETYANRSRVIKSSNVFQTSVTGSRPKHGRRSATGY